MAQSEEEQSPGPHDESTSTAPQIEGGAYEIIQRRLVEQSKTLQDKVQRLNAERVDVFGGVEMAVVGNERVRTDHNCIPRDIASVHGGLLFGYNVYLGLKKEIHVADVLTLHAFVSTKEGFAFEPVTDGSDAFLKEPQFVKEFTELYDYYKQTRLIQLRCDGRKLLAVFQVGDAEEDVKVFRWGLTTDGDVAYIDNRGEDEHVWPPSHDFEWVTTTRDDFVLGAEPHVNIKDTVFVETIKGDLTVKVEDNTDDGQGIYREDVEDKNQSLADAKILYAQVGTLILLKILPYREEVWRYLVFNTRTHDVQRIDAIGQSCQQLPEDHGIIFPGGFYLQNGDMKTFAGNLDNLRFLRHIASPNGEDVLYAFYEVKSGTKVLLPYNLIRKEVENIITCQGSSIFDDGKMVVFRAKEEPTRVHQMRIWQTAFVSAEFAEKMSAESEHAGSFLVKIGNPELVRGISDALAIASAVNKQEPSLQVYEDLIAHVVRVIDTYPWLDHQDAHDLLSTVTAIRDTAELVIDEFEKVQAISAAAKDALLAAKTEQTELLLDLRPETWETVDKFVDAMARLRAQRGQLITLKEMRYMDLPQVDVLEEQVTEKFDYLSEQATVFLLKDEALTPYVVQNDAVSERIAAMIQGSEAEEISAEIERMATALDLLTEVVSALQIDDALARTKILEEIGEIFALVNRSRASLEGTRKTLLNKEGVAEFGAQFKLYGQSVQSALGLCNTPEKCDEQLTRLMVQLEELEGRFSEFDQFLGDLAQKREEVYESISARKQQLLEERQRRAQNLAGAADRILQGVTRRVRSFKKEAELNSYFAADSMVLKVRDLVAQLMDLGDTVRADEVGSRIKRAREDAIRQLRDKSDLFDEEGGDNVIKFGKHRFTVNTQNLDLTILPHDGGQAVRLTGTDYLQPITDERFAQAKRYWDQALVSEDTEVYRGEYLAASVLFAAEALQGGLSLDRLTRASLNKDSEINDDETLLDIVRDFAASKYDEGYDRGVHDVDASIILEKLLGLYATAGLLRYAPRPRAFACLYWALATSDDKERLQRKAQSLGRLKETLAQSPAHAVFAISLQHRIFQWSETLALPCSDEDARVAGQYLAEELSAPQAKFSTSSEAQALLDAFWEELELSKGRAALQEDLAALGNDVTSQYELCTAWLSTFVAEAKEERVGLLAPVMDEAVALLLCGDRLPRQQSGAMSSMQISPLLGNHGRIVNQAMALRLDEFLVRLSTFAQVHVPAFIAFRKLRAQVIKETKNAMRVEEFQPKVLSSFVRNKLINDVYLPLIGDNLAKQMGAVGAKKRTDLMGMLLLISPPGYGKTTLMEYIASRLGLVFMKVNGPSLGHDVVSLDPAQAPNATARQEVEKINLGFEMGNNVMLYLDDIQHTNPELLQKFISLCDGSRRVEGVWQGKTRTYDMRGKKFCVVMAGNPYTESGDKFQVPDMLSNRADTYNLGDILGGQADTFALSYIENCLTSNPVLQPLATRSQEDVYLLIRMAKGEEIPLGDLKYGYSAVEVDELVSVFKKLAVCQKVLLQVNQEYIRSAGMDDKYRTEPSFKLQGSYRNMSKLAEKVVAVMNDDELEQLIDDHYNQESQTLTTGAEQNLLKLAAMRGRQTPEQKARWTEICEAFQREKRMGGDESDPVNKISAGLGSLSEQLEGMHDVLNQASSSSSAASSGQVQALQDLSTAIATALKRNEVAASAQLDAQGEQMGALVDVVGRAAKFTAQTQRDEITAQTQALTTNSQALSKWVQSVQQSLSALNQTQVAVNVAGPQVNGFGKALSAQVALIEGTLVPLLQKAQAQAVAPVAAPVTTTAAPTISPAAASTPVDLGAVPAQVKEALALLRELSEHFEEGVTTNKGVYRPFKPKPMGTRAEEK